MGVFKLVLLFAVVQQIQAVPGYKYFERDRCVSQGGVLKQLDDSLAKGEAHVFFGMKIPCEGKVKEWQFFAQETGSLYLSVWRRDKMHDTLMLINKNRVTVESVGDVRAEIPVKERITVEVDDVIGLHYEKYNDPTVISMQTGGELELGAQVAQFNMLDHDLKQGFVLPEGETIQGTSCIKATVVGISQNLKLIDGPHGGEGEGLAVMYRGKTWGTICDKWFVSRGWPLLFCYEIGYPDVKYATEAFKTGLPLKHDHPIHSTNPRCKPSQMLSIADCERHSVQTCTHHEDIYIKCASKLRLQKAPGKSNWYIPQMFDNGIWGEICDNRPPSFHLSAPSSSWLTAVCSELNKGALKNVERYAQTGIVTKSLMENPECGDVINPNNLNQCRSGPLETECDGLLYYVQCEKS